MNNNQILITKEGLEKLKEEYYHLLEKKRPLVVERLANSRQAGDLTENSEYIQAKEELSFIDGRISELEEVLKRVTLISNNHKKCQRVNLGCRVTVESPNGKKEIFHLVGEWEADPTTQKISYTSPLGRLLLGKKVGQEIELEAPAGKIVYTIVEID